MHNVRHNDGACKLINRKTTMSYKETRILSEGLGNNNNNAYLNDDDNEDDDGDDDDDDDNNNNNNNKQ